MEIIGQSILIEALQPALIHINFVYVFKRQLSLRIRHQHSLSRDSSCRHPIGCFCVVCNNMRRKWRGIIRQLRTVWWRTRRSTFPTDLRCPTGVEWPCTEQFLQSSWPCCRPRTSWSGQVQQRFLLDPFHVASIEFILCRMASESLCILRVLKMLFITKIL